MSTSSSKKNFYISYLKGIAILAVIGVHLINWSEMPIGNIGFYLLDMLHVGLLFFITLSGSLIVIAYGKYDSIRKPTKRLIKRAFLLLGIYFAYSIIKWGIYDFSREPFFLQFIEKGKWGLQDIFTFQAFTVPMTVLVLWAEFLLVTPIILYINRHFKHKKAIVLGLIGFFALLNYFVVIPRNHLTEILYGENNVLFSFNLWFLPYLIGLYLGMIGFHKKKKEILTFFGISTLVFMIFHLKDNLPFTLDPYMYPLKPYYISVCFFVMFLFIYALEWLEKIRNKTVQRFLATLRYFGDNTMLLFVTHWIIIDITRWFFHPYWIWVSIGSMFVVFYFYNNKNINRYQEESYEHHKLN